jgi:galactokinase
MAPAPRSTALDAFGRTFDGAPDHLVQAPGRVNLIGEHTDYNDGFVMPCAIDRGTVVAARLRGDMRVNVVAADLCGALDSFRIDEPVTPRADAGWANYVRGSVKHLLDHGAVLRGADLAIAGDVPQGAGLSSSASLEVAVLQAFKTLDRLDDLQPADMARIAQAAENRFVGCACGIMDQLISACGVEGHALLLDCRSLHSRAVPLAPELALMIIDSRVQRGLVGSAYNLRRQQCDAAARHYGVAALRDLDVAALDGGRRGLDPIVFRRARHIVTENRRTLDAAAALASGDMARVGTLMAQSHASMRDDFEITVPAVDHLVDTVQAVLGVDGGCRMTGGGFGGCVIALLPATQVDTVRAQVMQAYRAPGGEPARIHLCRAAGGAGVLE